HCDLVHSPEQVFVLFILLHRPAAHRDLHSFPTRRSSDLRPPPPPSGRSTASGPRSGPRSRRPVATSPSSGWSSPRWPGTTPTPIDRKSTRLNSSHDQISYAVFCLKKKIASSLT